MMTEHTVKTSKLTISQADLARKVKLMAIIIPVVTLLIGVSIIPLDIRFGLFTVAVILGWTQLVGL